MAAVNATDNTHLHMSQMFLIFKITALGIILLLNIIVNSLTLIILPKVPDMNPATRVFLTSMTLSDLGGGFGFILPVFVSTIINRWPFEEDKCAILAYMNYTCGFISAMSLLSVNFERYLTVTKPLRYRNIITAKRAFVICVGLWMFSALLSASCCFMFGRRGTYSENLHACTTGPADPTAQDVHGTVFIVLFIIAPLATALVLFFRMFIIALSHAAKIAAQKKAKSENKAFVTFFIMTCCLTVGWYPISIAYIYENMTRKVISAPVMCLYEILAFSNTVVNVLVYYLRNRVFKETAKKLILLRLQWINNWWKNKTPVVPFS